MHTVPREVALVNSDGIGQLQDQPLAGAAAITFDPIDIFCF